MASYQEIEQVQAFARIDGVLLATLWTASFTCMVCSFSVPMLGMAGGLIGAASLVYALLRLKKFRDEVLDGLISYRRALAYSLFQYLYCSLLFAGVQYIYFRFIDHGFLLGEYMQMLQMPEIMDTLKRVYGFSAAEIKVMMDNLSMLTPIQIALQFFTTNVMMGIVMSIPAALIMRRLPVK